MEFETHKINSVNHISVHIQSELFPIGCAELSKFLNENQFYFNRLFIQPKFRGKGFAHILMKEIIEIVDERKIDIILDINPYGDLNYNQLLKFYQKYDFKLYDNDHLIRRCQLLNFKEMNRDYSRR